MVPALCGSGFLAAGANIAKLVPDSFAVKVNLFPPSPPDPKIEVDLGARPKPNNLERHLCCKVKIEGLENKLSVSERNMLQQARISLAIC